MLLFCSGNYIKLTEAYTQAQHSVYTVPIAEIFLLMAATNQSNSLAYRFLAKASLETEADAASRFFTMRSPMVSMARVVRAVIS